MERLDFASVMAVLRRNVGEECCTNQTDFVYALLRDVDLDPNYAVDFDPGQVCRWLSGLARVSPDIISFYQTNSNQKKLAQRIETDILPMMPDSAMAVQELHDLLMQAPNVSQQKKTELTEGFSFEEENDAAGFITEVLCLAMQLRFEKRDVRHKQLPEPGSLSPRVMDYIFDTDLPRACRWFLGRTQELEQLHRLLTDHSKVFVHGIPGIGKSELAKAYAQQHKKEYTNIIYLNYAGDLQQAVTELDFADDLPNEMEEARFKRHNRFLRSLREDTLLIVDNFNTTATQDSFLDVLLKYRCRIVFTTRCRYENHISMELKELPDPELLELVETFYPQARKQQEVVEGIIRALHGHTFAVELAARLLANGILKPGALLFKLESEKAAMDAQDRIGAAKDGCSSKATYYDHIHNLFALCGLSDAEQEILRSLTLTPARGISARRFAQWLELTDLNTVNDLVEMGLVQPLNDWMLALHPMIQEVAVEELKPSVQRCKVLLSGIQQVCLRHGEDISYHKALAQTICNVARLARKDDAEGYLRFLEDAFPCMVQYRCGDAQKLIVEEMAQLLQADAAPIHDRALLLDYRAAMEEKPERAIELDQQALALLPEVNEGNAHLAANIHANIGMLYHQIGNFPLAQQHLEAGISILEQFRLTQMHDSIIQINNYAVLLCNMGQPERGMAALRKLARFVRDTLSDSGSDYAAIQEAMGSICLTQGKVQEATAHFQKAMDIYETLYAGQPDWIEEKRQKILETYGEAGVYLAKRIKGNY